MKPISMEPLLQNSDNDHQLWRLSSFIDQTSEQPFNFATLIDLDQLGQYPACIPDCLRDAEHA